MHVEHGVTWSRLEWLVGGDEFDVECGNKSGQIHFAAG